MSKSLDDVLADVDRWKEAVAKELATLSPAEQDVRLKEARAWFHAEMDNLARPKRRRKPIRKARQRVR